MRISRLVACLVLLSLSSLRANSQPSGQKRLVIIAGTPSHKAGEHEYNAGALLMKKWLANSPDMSVTVCLNGWPTDTTLLARADGIVLFMDGKQGHLVLKPAYKRQLLAAVSRGVGVAALHYAVTLPAGDGDPLLDILGGFKEDSYSAHGMWTSDVRTIPVHPVTSGVKPFQVYDECYFFLRFRAGISPILTATPPDSVRNTIASRAAPGRPEVVSWVYERPDGGRSFGNTGLHFHTNWRNDDLRKLILNACRWICRLPVPAGGVQSTVTDEELSRNLDPKEK
ncbi:ThuA domain-containing protein [Spirosoma fluviale]|uniref:Trehalose utilisation n=1 Tax=Spirosoma fluviale TaxID=1597977 RepID=A0A286GUU7_9BACT|nr:ThuA domain-containing protein [Spirosoma fluviale]SOD99337.1 Trehalose utilisation [Spirosoma fluviale]